ncbi:DUF3788 domain-containing protein [Extibacter muris]|uniref:DUF3788 domain-containing protein n=1 Tax=Extibacter muris TaxID=1796622 RepID=A0A4R4FC00_9FIRM|nr:DUF3788 domain-containing protein [Extibacter muris]MCU0080423.1 DUF3788 domain-containing protein [Extibacter muris]TDA20995.1 DUF3788 domain-containing protein [Extibacter muris]
MDWNMLYSNVTPPTWEQVTEYIGSPLWADFNEHIQSTYQITPYMEHSRCSMQAGWNVKYKKGGKSLCTLYPMEGHFIVLVVIGSHELTEAELLMPLCSEYVQSVFKKTKTGNGQKWLMLEVRDSEIMENVFRLINLRKRIPS